jgi:hypothetical protein
MKFRKIALPFLMVTLGVNLAYAKKGAQVRTGASADPGTICSGRKAIGREKVVIKNIQQRTPLVETYIQEMKPDEKLYQVPTGDTYMLNRVDFRKTFTDKPYAARAEKRRPRLLQGLGWRLCQHRQGAASG